MVKIVFAVLQFSAFQELASHSAPVTCVTGVYLLPSDRKDGESPLIRTLIASASGDSTLKVWERPTVGGENKQ